MAKGPVFKPVFKAYQQRQTMLLPPSLEELIALKHPVRVVDEVLGKINLQPLINCYATGGAASYHPAMLLKVMVYAYINNIYSSRKIEEALQQNIHFMWLSGMSTPDHNTINRFRGDKLRKPLKEIFTQVVHLLAGEGLLSLKEIYTDGTKIEANANRYTFVWGNAIKTNKEKMKQQLDELWKYAQSIAGAESDDTDPTDFTTVTKENMEAAIAQIDAAIKDNPAADKKIKQKLSYAKAKWPAALERYEMQEKIMGDNRNSYCKTDTDATFMRMKEDHMMNGQLKPAYNLQLSSNGQYIANYSIHQATTDTTTLISHLDDFSEHHQQSPDVVTADAGYGSEENYQYLEQKSITAFVKYNQFDREQNTTIQTKRPFASDKLHYNKEEDYYVCPMGQHMKNMGKHNRITATGFIQEITKYTATNCAACPLNGACHKSQANRTIEINHHLNKLKEKANQNLLSEEGIKKRKQRCHDIEPVFANIKNNHGFKRFMLRGKEKVLIETGLLALAHNLRKKAA
ncbi:MAG: IS1182 family transposase [Bacteroidota bacterium]|nr:IS1182 family transposase [Bacteroidota bacterium]